VYEAPNVESSVLAILRQVANKPCSSIAVVAIVTLEFLNKRTPCVNMSCFFKQREMKCVHAMCTLMNMKTGGGSRYLIWICIHIFSSPVANHSIRCIRSFIAATAFLPFSVIDPGASPEEAASHSGGTGCERTGSSEEGRKRSRSRRAVVKSAG
jgi:hypothetical protein